MLFRASDNESSILRPADIVLGIGLIVLGFVLSYFVAFGKSDGDRAEITAAGEQFGVYSLLEDRTVVVDQDGCMNKLRIEDGKVRMIDSDCRGSDCVHEGQISKTGETIVCLPNKVVVEITGGEGDFDAISR